MGLKELKPKSPSLNVTSAYITMATLFVSPLTKIEVARLGGWLLSREQVIFLTYYDDFPLYEWLFGDRSHRTLTRRESYWTTSSLKIYVIDFPVIYLWNFNLIKTNYLKSMK